MDWESKKADNSPLFPRARARLGGYHCR